MSFDLPCGLLLVYLADEDYERSFEQNEELGLNDLDTSSADAAYSGSTGVVDVKDDAGRLRIRK